MASSRYPSTLKPAGGGTEESLGHEFMNPSFLAIITNLQQHFPVLPRETILRIVKENEWAEVRYFPALFLEVQKHNNELLRKEIIPPTPMPVRLPPNELSPHAAAAVLSPTATRLHHQAHEQTRASSHPAQVPILLTVAPDIVYDGELITVKWEIVAPSEPDATSWDWIGMYQIGKVGDQYTAWKYVSLAGGTRSGLLTFEAPKRYGKYYFSYYKNSQYICRANSELIRVGPQFEMQATPAGGNTVEVKVVQKGGDLCTDAWVGMYAPAEASYKTYKYLTDGRAVENTPTKKTMAMDFELPKAGQWIFRLFVPKNGEVAHCVYELHGEDQVKLVVEDVSRVTAICTLATVDPRTDNPWVGLYRVDEVNDKTHIGYEYVTRSQTQIVLRLPNTPGIYEARLFASGYTLLAKSSNRVTVSGPSASVCVRASPAK